MRCKGVYLDETPFYGTLVHSTELHNELISILAGALPIDEMAPWKRLKAEERTGRGGKTDKETDWEVGETTVKSVREREQ